MTEDLVSQELERTGAATGEVLPHPPRPAEMRKLEGILRSARSPKSLAFAHRNLEQERGAEALYRELAVVIEDPNYQGLPAEARKDVLEAVIAKFRRDLGQMRRAQ